MGLVFSRDDFDSKVPGHMGLCVPTWRNQNYICNREDGGMSGFFRKARKICRYFYWTSGEQFHGLVPFDTRTAMSTHECYNRQDIFKRAVSLGIVNNPTQKPT